MEPFDKIEKYMSETDVDITLEIDRDRECLVQIDIPKFTYTINKEFN